MLLNDSQNNACDLLHHGGFGMSHCLIVGMLYDIETFKWQHWDVHISDKSELNGHHNSANCLETRETVEISQKLGANVVHFEFAY